MNTTDLITLIGYFIGVAGSVVFVARYSFAGWWRTAEGRAIMGLHLGWAYFGFLSWMRMEYGANYAGRPFLVIIGVYGFGAAVWACTFLLFRAQRRGRAKRALIEEPEPEPIAEVQ